MSIQQDKRVVKPSKMSERYARWFGTRVPSTSPMFRYLLMFFLSVPISVLANSIFLPGPGMLLTILIVTASGAIIYPLYLIFLDIRFRSTAKDSSFSQIAESARSRVGARENVQIWPQKNDEPYIAPTFNLLFDAILISDAMINLVEQMPESGEALLAFHLFKGRHGRNVLDMLVAVLPFFVVSSLFAFILMGTQISSFTIVLIILVFIGSGWLLFAPVLLAVGLKAATWTHDSAFEEITRLYGIHPQVAKDEVLSSRKLDEEAARATIWVVREWEQNKRSGRRNGIIFLVMVLVFMIDIFGLTVFGMLFYFPYMMLFPLLIGLPPTAAGLIAFLTIRRWDKRCMSELYYATKQADEPIWID